jgi:hypothetical protein
LPSAPTVGAGAATGEPALYDTAAQRETESEEQFSFEREMDSTKPWRVLGVAQYRSLVIADEDPANDRHMLYDLRGDFKWLPGFLTFAQFGMKQLFTVEPDESAFRIRDTKVGAEYRHRVKLAPVGLTGEKLGLFHRLQVILPTSRESRAQDLYFAIDNENRVRYNVIHRLEAGINLGFQYRFHEYAERAGLQGAQNTKAVLPMALVVEETVIQHRKYGAVMVGADGRLSHAWQYASRDEHQSPASDSRYGGWQYGWDLYVEYLAPFPNLIATVSLEHAGQVMRDGIVNTFWSHRDETEIALTVIGLY